MFCVVFDFDGTLVKSNEIKRQTFFDSVAEFENGKEIIAKILEEPGLKTRADVFQEFAVHYAENFDINKLVDSYGRICEEKVSLVPEVRGATSCLRSLSQTHQLYINSATPFASLNEIVKRRNMSGFFCGIYGSPDSKLKNLKQIAKKSNQPKHRMIMVGDGAADQQAAEEFGCKFIAIGLKIQKFSVEPDFWLEDLIKLPSVIERL